MKKALRYYNMIVHLIQNNRLFEEKAAVKKVWQKDGLTFLDIYFYRNQKSYVFDSCFIHDLVDLTTEKFYKNVKDFIQDYYQEESQTAKISSNIAPAHDKKLFAPIELDLTMMLFVAGCCGEISAVKEKIIRDYIVEQIPSSQNLSRQYLNAYIGSLHFMENDFYLALGNIKSKEPEEAEKLVKEIVKICLSDGRIHYQEKIYLAEILQTLRELGVNPDIGL